MSILGRKARRDLARQRWQFLGVALIVFLGVGLFAASYDAFLNLETSYRRTYDRLAFADLTITGPADAAGAAVLADRVGGDGEVAAVTGRRQADIAIRVGGDHTLLGRVIELPDAAQPAVDRVDVLSGSLPSAAGAGATGAVAVERHMADHFGLGPGSRLEMRSATGWETVDVTARVASAEYIWPARSRQDVLTSLDDFGVVFAPTGTFERLTSGGAVANQTLVRLAASAGPTAVDRLASEAVSLGATGVQTRADQPSNAALQEDVSGFGELSFLFPMLFLGASALATFVLLGRVVLSQRSQIASLRANGVAARSIVAHYLGEGVAVTTVAGTLGLIAGVAAGRLVTGVYTAAIDVPDTVTGFHPATVAVGLVLAVATGAVAAAAPAIAAGRTQPAAVLRGVTPAGHGGRSIVERVVPPLRRLPARWRMVLRGVGRDPRRSLSTGLGVVLALTLVLASWGMVDTVDILLQRQFEQVQRQDAQLFLAAPSGGASTTGTGAGAGAGTDSGAGAGAGGDVMAAIGAVGGVTAVERVAQTTVVVSAGDRRYPTELIGFVPDTRMHDLGGADLGAGLVAGSSLESLLDVAIGDQVTVTSTGSGTTTTAPIVAFVDEPLGTYLYGDLDLVAGLEPGPGADSVMVTFDDGVDRDAMRSRLTAVPGVVAYVDSRALYDTAQSLLSLFYAFVGVMLAFGGLMAFALIFNTATANASERAAELASLKVNGAAPGQLARLLAGENLLLTALAIPAGLAVGYGVSAVFMSSFSSDLFQFDLHMRTRTLVLSAMAVLAVSALAQWPASRTVTGLDVGRVVRERSQ